MRRDEPRPVSRITRYAWSNVILSKMSKQVFFFLLQHNSSRGALLVFFLLQATCLAWSRGSNAATDRLLGVQVNGDDQTVETQYLGEDEDQDHADEESGLLSGSPDTGITDDANSESGGQTGKAYSQTST